MHVFFSHFYDYTDNWKEEILEYIDADQLPVHWGGTQMGPDGDTKCLHLVSILSRNWVNHAYPL